jgi:L-2-hydroxyglutarate oxidase LhgO
MSDHVDCVVVGAGVIGLAVARAMAMAGREVIVLERNANIGEETSSRNSEVIHAGIYYPTGSLKARLCIAGKAMLYDYCNAKQVPFRRSGKLIVATDTSQLDRLDRIAAQAASNGVDDLVRIDQAELGRREPEVAGVAALWSPSTGIVDSHALMLALQGDLETAGGVVATRAEVTSIRTGNGAIGIETRSDDEAGRLTATTVINAAGLEAVDLARRSDQVADVPIMRLAKGNYFSYSGKSPFETLVYPLPVDGGLGIHATLDLGGRLRFGPDVEWIDAIDYSVDETRHEAFAASIRTYWKGFDETNLVPGYSGIRPKLSGPGEAPADFRIEVAPDRRLVHLFGIESPGLTAALAIAEEVRRRIESPAG